MNKLKSLLIILLPIGCLADVVVPIDSVENSVNIRLSPDASSDVVGKLDQGSTIEWLASEEGWHEVQLEGDSSGYISADWSRVVVEEPAAEEVVEDVVEEVIVAEVEEVEDVEEVEEVIEEVEEVIKEGVVEEVIDEVVEVEVVEEIVEEVVVEAPVVAAVEKNDKEAMVLKGSKNFLVRFRDTNAGGNSQIYDDGNRIGIGTTAPQQRLEVNGSIQIHEQNSSVAGLMITQSSGDTGYIMHNRASTLTIGAGSQDRITIDRDGNVGIAVARPEHPLEMASGAHVTQGGVWTNSSSRAKKENIAVLEVDAATSALMALEPVIFNYREELGEDYVGFIAEDVPDLVAVGDRDALSTMDIVAVLTRVVQEQQIKIKELESRLDAM